MADLTISDGEIALILKQEAQALVPEYERLKQSIRSSGVVHFDET